MIMKIKTKTIKGWVNNSDLLFSQNSNNRNFRENLEKYKQENNLVEYPFFKSGFFSKRNKDKIRVIIKGWYWRGSWSDPAKETVCYLIER